jgi:hypothetical protein
MMISQDLASSEESRRDIIEHKLQVNPFTKPSKQRLRKMSDKKVATAKAEV